MAFDSAPLLESDVMRPDRMRKADAVYLQPGQVKVAGVPTVMRTILGSCVSVCLYDPLLRIGGMNHFLLPQGPTHSTGDEGRYAGSAIAKLIEKLRDMGASPSRLQAKVFGGARILMAPETSADKLDLGARNAKEAMAVLRDAKIPVVAENVGGWRGRQLVFHTDTGDAWIRAI